VTVISASLDGLWVRPDLRLGNVTGEIRLTGETLDAVSIRARGPEDEALTLWLGAREDGRRAFRLTSQDAGASLRAAAITTNVKGGRLLVEADRARATPAPPWTGRLVMRGFRIGGAPILTRILTLASLGGVVDTLSGRGIAFRRLELPFSLTDRRIVFKGGRAVGSELGVTANGWIDREASTLALRGTLVPAYTLNSLLGKLPLLGTLLTGEKGSGVFAVTFAVDGPLDKPKVSVNPLAALAPGFLRNLVDLLGGKGSNAAEPSFPNTSPE
jgi:AsmA-like C-terminal region